MKRNILLAILPLTLLSSCGTNNYDVAFKEYELTNAEVLRDEELEDFKTKVLKEAGNINHFERHIYSVETYIMSQSESKIDSICDFYLNMSRSRATAKYKSSGNGITMSDESDSTVEVWNLNQDDYIGVLLHTYDAIKHIHVFEFGSQSSTTILPPSDRINSSVFSSTQRIYKTSNCYYSINSYKSRRVEYVSFGNQTREKISEANYQQCYEISLDYRVINGHIFSNTISSVDSITGEWFDSPKEIAKTTGNIYYEYNGQTQADTTKIIEDYKAYSPIK